MIYVHETSLSSWVSVTGIKEKRDDLGEHNVEEEEEVGRSV